MFTARRSSYQAALDKARALGTGRTVVQVDPTTYRVPSATLGGVYTVRLNADGDLVCDCRAGQAGLACYHAAACWLRRVAQAATVHTPTRESAAQVRERLRAESRASVARWNDAELDEAPSLYAAAV